MEKLIENLKGIIPFKEVTEIGDLVLVVAENPQLLIYAQVTSLQRDTTRRDEWWHIGLTFLAVPLQKVVWTLRTDQMTGQEIFTMGGEKRFLKAVDLHRDSVSAPPEQREPQSTVKPGLKRVK